MTAQLVENLRFREGLRRRRGALRNPIMRRDDPGSGEAFTIVGEDDVRHARSIERFIDSTIERKRLENFPYTYSALFTDEANATATKPASRLAGRLRR